jgi:hypothetical protein
MLWIENESWCFTEKASLIREKIKQIVKFRIITWDSSKIRKKAFYIIQSVGRNRLTRNSSIWKWNSKIKIENSIIPVNFELEINPNIKSSKCYLNNLK